MSVMLNELAERFPMPSNYLGVIGEQEFRVLDQKQPIGPEALMDESLPQTSGMLYPVCEYLPEEKIPHAMVMGRTVWDFNTWKSLPSPKRLPFEIECHFTLNEESLRRLKTDAVSIPKTASLHTLQAGTSWDFPLIELIMSQDPLERRLGLTEALAMSGFSPEQLQELLLTAAWVSAWARFQMKTFTLESIRLRFAMDLNGQWKLYDGFTMDDLYLEQNGIRFHTDTALDFYSKTSWYESVVHARKHSAVFGLADWKRLCVEPSPWLDPKFKANLEERIRMAAEGLAGKV
jgi:hypothetical protein